MEVSAGIVYLRMPIRDSNMPATLLLPPHLLGSIDYYAAIEAYDSVVIDTDMRFNKRDKEAHRFTIADANGIINLTVPIEKPTSMTTARWSDIVISSHGHWWNIQLTALKSAYGRTPFFEYYIDDFIPFFNDDCPGMKLTDYIIGLDKLVRRLMGIETSVTYTTDKNLAESSIIDYRNKDIDFTTETEYYQVRALKQGFIPHLSAIDLLFNLGPESRLLLHNMIN